MIFADIKNITAPADAVEINKNELALRLKTDRDFDETLLDKCRREFDKTVTYKCAYIRTAVDTRHEGICDFGFMSVPSRDLYKNLRGCKEAFVLAVTTGIAVDRMLARLNIVSQAEHFMADALSSAAVESFCDYACDIMTRDVSCVPRYSPGYGDLSISFQKPLLARLNACETLGITLNSAYLMTPVKSITAIMGIKTPEDKK